MTPTDRPLQALLAAHPADLPVPAVREALLQCVQPLTEREQVPLAQALGRVLAEDVVSPVDVPPHDNAAMDGYAFAGAALRPGEALRLRVVPHTVLAGGPAAARLGAGECVRIMTGAVMPEGADTVVPHERVQIEGNTLHLPADTVAPGSHRRCRGEDLRAGHSALPTGLTIGPAALGLLASLGLDRVPVVRRMRVACLSTGNELLEPGAPARPGAIYDSNRHTLRALLTRLGAEVIDLGVVPDEPAAIEAAFRRAANEADAILTSGGVGAGDADHTRQLMQRLGQVAFCHLAMRPGRPFAAGVLPAGDTAAARAPTCLFGLPGNPVAAMVSFLMIVRPALQRLMGATPQVPLPVPAHCTAALKKRPGRTEYLRAQVQRQADGRLTATPAEHQGSGVLRSMLEANALIVLAHDQGPVAAGDSVDVLLFDGLL